MAPRARFFWRLFESASTNLYGDDNIDATIEKKIFSYSRAIHSAVHTLRNVKAPERTTRFGCCVWGFGNATAK
jgi:hypothetical protein